MGVAVLKPEDCLRLPNPVKYLKNPSPNPNPNPNRTNRTQSNRKKHSPNSSPPSRPTVGPKVPVKSLVVGQVKILKRGEDLKKITQDMCVRFENENVGVDLGSTNCLSPDPGYFPTQIRLLESKNSNNSNKVVPAAFYAGSAFITSPPPSSVPMPAFFSKKIGVPAKDNDATSGLRRILGLDL